MELSETGVQIRDCTIDFIPVYVKEESDEHGADFNDAEIIAAAHQFCDIEIKENQQACDGQAESIDEKGITDSQAGTLNTGLADGEENETCNISTVLNSSVYLQNLDCESLNAEIEKSVNQVTEVFINHNEPMQMTNYNISTVTIESEFLGVNLNIKKEGDINSSTVYTTEWTCNNSRKSNSLPKARKNRGETEGNSHNTRVSPEHTTVPVTRERSRIVPSNENSEDQQIKVTGRVKKCMRAGPAGLQDYKDKLKRKAECMREKRKKLYEQESEDQRLQRLAKEAAKRREMRMYYETPEQRRKRLDAEAARKREYRMYNETPEDKRRRLDREAERRRIKRLSMYASETPEQRKERLNKESAKRREARLNQYAKETDDERKERLRKDALRVREMRFTRSAIETEDERRQRLVKDALRKREVRMHGGHSVSTDFTELQTVRNLEELHDVQIKDNGDSQLGGHYLSNWMMWFQNTLAQPVHTGEQVAKSAQNSV